MSHFIFVILVTLIYSFKYVVGSDDFKSSLSFVIDDTASMSDDIDEVKLGANAIFDTVLTHNASQIENFLLVTFNDNGYGDPGVILRTKTKDREEFKNALSAIDVHGGGDCPEYSMTGIKTALEESLDRSYLYIFTDATAKDYNEYEEVKAIAQKKGSQVVFVLTGQCYEPASSPAYRVYNDMAEATNGEVFHLKKSEVGKILEYVKKTITGRRATLAVEKLPPGKHNMTFNADVIMGEITLSLASDKSADPSVTITAPDGSDVWKSILFETDQIQVYSVDVTMAGPHTVEVNSKAETRAVVSARSGIDFQHGFSAFKLSSMVDTSTRPAPGKSHLSIKLNEGDILLQTVQILDMDDNVKLELPLEILNKDTKFYSTRAFDPPNTMFKIAIIGYDPKSKSNITRMATTPVEPQKLISGKKIDNRRPSVLIEGGPVVNAEFNKPRQLICNVNGFPEPTVVWKNKNKGTIINGEVAIKELPYEYTSVINIEKVQENVTYECEANNSVGSDTKQVTVNTFNPRKFIVLDTPQRIQIEYQKEGQISCIVDAYPPADITWYKNRTKLVPNGNIEISANKSVVTIKHATPSDKGRYMCEARNRDKRKLIYRYVTITGTENIEIDKDVSDITVKKGSSVVIECRILKGIPKPSINWYHASVSNLYNLDEIREWKNKERVELTIDSERDAGSYICEATNVISADYHEISLHLKFPPTITEGVKSINAASGSKVSIPCHADGGPRPHVTWYKDDVEITNSDKIDIFGDQTLRLVAQSSDSGYYTCKATNELGSVNKTVKVDVNVPVTIKPPLESNSSVLVGSKVTLPCEASGEPKPNLKWVYHSFSATTPVTKTLRSSREDILQLEHIQLSQEGYYTCVASNAGGSMNITYELHVFSPPFIKNTDLDKRFEAVEGDLALRIACEASGNPKPIITWKKDGLNLALGTTFYVENGMLFIRDVPKDANGTYMCEATNSLGTARELYHVIVNGHPSSLPTSSILVEQGKPAEINCTAPHKDINHIRWYKNGALIQSGELTLINPTVRDSGDYTCRVGDFLKSVSSTTRVIVGSKPEFTISAEDENIEIMEGPPISLNCENRGQPKPEVEWYVDGMKLNETESEYYLSMDTLSPGQYKCIVNNTLGSITKTFNIFPRDCFMDSNKLTELHPLMLTSSLQWPMFEKFGDYMIFLKGEQFILLCPKRFKIFPNRYITAFCDGGTNILINGEKYDYTDIQCTEEVEHTVRRTGVKCLPGDTEKVSIEYKILDYENVEVYEVCMNKTSETPIYAKYAMQSSSADDEYEATWSDSDQFIINLDEAYNCKNQINTIASQLGRWFHNDDECCFSKRQLVNHRDVFPGAPQKSTFSYFNVVPQWSTCNADNWAEVEWRVRNFAKNSYSEVLVWTGTAKELSLKSFRGMTSHFFTDRRGNEQPVPMFLWKVIQDPASMSSLAIIQVNVPDLTLAEAPRYVLCRDQCDVIDWMKNLDWRDVTKGYTYCCSLEEFQRAFGFEGVFERNMTPLLTSEANVLPDASLTT